MRFSNILLVLDTRRPGQEQALRTAAALARIGSTRLTVCEAVDWVTTEVPRYMTAGTVQILTDALVADKIRRLNKLVAASNVSVLEIAVKALIGKPHIEVARIVRENQHDLVIKPFAGHRVMQFFSAVHEDRELIRSCPCPVWLVNVAEQDDNNCILAALGMPAEGDLESGLNQHIMEISRSIALAESRPLHFVHAWHLRGEGHMRAQCNPATDLQVDRMLAREAARRITWLQNTVATPRPDILRSATEKITPELHVLKGHAKKVIPDLAGKLGAGLIVMGTAARTGVSGILRRNTAETILPRSDCSLLIVKRPEPIASAVSKAERTLQVG